MSTDDAAYRLRIETPGERAIGAQQIRDAYTGDVNVLPARALYAANRVTAAPGTSNLPPATLCLGREEELTWLRHILTDQCESAITQSGAVHGLGGIGKSTLALRYAHRHRDDYTLIWWINAASPNEIETSLTELTQALVPDLAATAERKSQVAWAMQWLAWHPGWLLVYDNVEDPDDLAPYTGALHQGHHLATSRRATGWPDSAPTLTLGNLNPDDATTLLCRLIFKGATPTPRQQADAHALTTDLGCFPLAIKQAGAYLAQNRGISLDAYRRRLGTKLGKAAHGIDRKRTIIRVWSVTLHALEEEDPLAVEVLHTAAWLAPDDIPHALLNLPGTDADDTAEAIGTLAAYSMVTDTGTALRIHRLVQTVLRSSLGTDGTQPPRHLQGRDRAEQTVLHHLAPPPGQESTTERQWDALTPHLVTLAATTPPGHDNAPLADGYITAAYRLDQQGHTARTIPLFQAALAQRKRAFGDAHPETLTCRNDLAHAYLSAGDLGRAIPLFESTLAQREELLRDTHPDTLQSRNNLANAYHSAGDLGRAIPLFESTLAQREELLRDTHPDTLQSRNNLANAYHSAGDHRRAIPLLEVTLAQREQLLGDTHVGTLQSRSNLAYAYGSVGEHRRAIPLLEVTLAQYEQVFGDTHPDTLTCRNSLANAYRSAGEHRRAIRLLEVTLAQRERVLGDTHPDTLTCRSDLACACLLAGDLGRAIPLLEVTLAQRERVLGDTHPSTLTSRSNLANSYGSAGDHRRAIPLLEVTLAQYEQVFGDTHPSTLTCRNSLAHAYLLAGDLGRAIPLLEVTLAQRERVLGDTHPSTLTCRSNLASAYHSAGDHRRAIPLFEATLAQYEQVLGDTHPDTLTSRSNLAYARVAAEAVQQPDTATPATAPHLQPPSGTSG